MPRKLNPASVVPQREPAQPPPETSIGAAEGDLGGTYPNPTVLRVHGTAVPRVVPGDVSKVLTVTNDTLGHQAAAWAPGGGGGGFTAGGDLTGTSTNQTVSKIRGVPSPDPGPIAVGDSIKVVASGSPLWAGAVDVLFDGTYLWVADGDTSGSNNVPDPLTRFIRVLDPTTSPPTLVDSIDLSSWAPFQIVRKLRLSSDSTKVYASIKGWKGGSPGSPAGRVLIIDKTTRTVVGNAEMTTGMIGGDSTWWATGARDAIDDGAGSLFAINSNQSTQGIVEKFSIAACLSNGTSPTSSTASAPVLDHAEELCFGAGFLWTSGAEYSQVITRINPSSLSMSTYTYGGSGFPWGMTFAFGALWCGNAGGSILRFDPAAFPGGGFLTDTLTPGYFNNTFNSFVSDGTFLWFSDVDHSPTCHVVKIDPTPGSVSIVVDLTLDTRDGSYGLAFDGQFVWGARRYFNAPNLAPGLFKIDTTPGSEAVVVNNFDGTTPSLAYSTEWFPNGPAGTGGLFDSLSGTYPNPYVRKAGGVEFTNGADQTGRGGAVPMLIGSQLNPPTSAWSRLPDGDTGASRKAGLSSAVQQTLLGADVPTTGIVFTSLQDVALVKIRPGFPITSVSDYGEYFVVLGVSGGVSVVAIFDPVTQSYINQYNLPVAGYTHLTFIGASTATSSGPDFLLVTGGGSQPPRRIRLQDGAMATLSPPLGLVTDPLCKPFFDGAAVWIGSTDGVGSVWIIKDPWGASPTYVQASVQSGPLGTGPLTHFVGFATDGDFMYCLGWCPPGSYDYTSIFTCRVDGTATEPGGPNTYGVSPLPVMGWVPQNIGSPAFQIGRSIAFDGKHLWVGAGDSVIRLDRFSSSPLDVMNGLGAAPIVMFDGEYVWALTTGESSTSWPSLLKIDPSRTRPGAGLVGFGSPFSSVTGFNLPVAMASSNASRDGASLFVLSSGDLRVVAVEDVHDTMVGSLLVKGATVDKNVLITQAGFPTPYQVTEKDTVVSVGTTTTAYTVVLPVHPRQGRRVTVVDDAGTAATRNITLNGGSHNINGASTLVMNADRQSRTVEYNGTEWNVVSGYQVEAGGGWRTAVNVSFAGAIDPGLSSNGIYTLAGIAGVKRENAAQDRVAMTTGAGGIIISPNASSYNPSTSTRTAPLLWFPFSSLGLTTLDLASALRILIRIQSSSQSVFDNGHGVYCGFDTDSTAFASWAAQATNTAGLRQFRAGVKAGTGLVQILNSGGSMSTGSFVLELEVPAILKAEQEAMVSYRDSVSAWPDLSTLSPVTAYGAQTAPFDGINPTNATLASLLGIVIAADAGATGDAYTVTVSDLRVDYRN